MTREADVLYGDHHKMNLRHSWATHADNISQDIVWIHWDSTRPRDSYSELPRAHAARKGRHRHDMQAEYQAKRIAGCVGVRMQGTSDHANQSVLIGGSDPHEMFTEHARIIERDILCGAARAGDVAWTFDSKGEVSIHRAATRPRRFEDRSEHCDQQTCNFEKLICHGRLGSVSAVPVATFVPWPRIGFADPFGGAAFPISSHEAEAIRCAVSLPIFVMNIDHAKFWRAELGDTASSNVDVLASLSDEAALNAIIAAGYQVRVAGSLDPVWIKMQCTAHKIRAISLLRVRLMDGKKPDIATQIIMHLLMSIEFDAMDYHAARAHMRGIKAAEEIVFGPHQAAPSSLIASDACIASRLFSKPDIDPKLYDPGPRRVQSFERQLNPLGACIEQTHLDRQRQVSLSMCLGSEIPDLIVLAEELANTRSLLNAVKEPDLIEKVAGWTQHRGAAFAGRVMNLYVDDCEAMELAHGSGRAYHVLRAATSLSCLLIGYLICFDMLKNSDLVPIFLRIKSLLQDTHGTRILAGASQDAMVVNLWLHLIAAVAQDLLNALGLVTHDCWAEKELRNLCKKLNVVEADGVREKIKHCVYLSPQMDLFLSRVLEMKALSRDSPVLSKAEWMSSLNPS